MRKYTLLIILTCSLQLTISANPPACDIVTGLAAINITNSSAYLKWNSLAGSVNYDVEYKDAASGTWLNLSTGTTATSVLLSGLSATTTYDWRVRANCIGGPGIFAPAQFTTGVPVYVCSGCVPGNPAPPPPPVNSLNYNTVIVGGGADWNAKIHLPWDYYTTANTYQAIIFFPGIGEIGTDISKLLVHGPHKFLAAGWNGNVKVDSDSVKFIIISLQPNAAFPNEALINSKLSAIKSQFRITPGKIHLTGLSQGGWCATTFVTGDPYGGPYALAGQIASVVEVQGIKPDDNQPYPNLFDNFALAGGRLLGFEQPLDGRDIPTRVNRMNLTVPNSAIFVATNFGTGGHCCFDNYYGSVTAPSQFNLDGRTENICGIL